MNDSSYFIVGANGQLGLALQKQYPNARFADIEELDITDYESVMSFDWSNTTHILNAAAFTNVDGAETPEGRVASWKVNAIAVGYLVEAARKHDMVLIHISSDYVFDGSQDPHLEEEGFSPLSVYGASKAAGDLLVTCLEKHYLLRTSWVIGDGHNFVKTMVGLAEKNVSPTVVSDQIGRLTFTSQLVAAIDHLVATDQAYGTYNVSNDGDSVSWADITREIFKLLKRDDLNVTDITTVDYYKGKEGIAPRPLKSTLDLSKLKETGLQPTDWRDDLTSYLQQL